MLAGDLTKVTSASHAIFGRLTLHPVEEIEIMLGGRYTRDRKTSTQPEFIVGILPDADPLSPAFDQRPTYLKQKFNRFTYDATVTYHVAPDINIYARYATAYLAGGQIRNGGFNPESTRSGEIGLKSDFFDRHLRINAAAFYQKSSNYQFANVSSINIAGGLGLVTVTGLANLAEQRVKGFEVEVIALPVPRFKLSASVGYSDQKFAAIQTGCTGGALLNLPAVRIAPDWTAQLAAQYDTPPLFDDAFVTFRLDAQYRGKYAGAQPTFPTTGVLPVELLTLYGLPTGTPAEVASSTAAYANFYSSNVLLGDYWIANARLSLSNVEIGGGTARISAYVKNIFDQDKPNVSAYYGYSSAANFVRKRELGLDLIVDF